MASRTKVRLSRALGIPQTPKSGRYLARPPAEADRGDRTADDTSAFMHAIWRSPGQLGAIAPSSRRLGALAASLVPGVDQPVVVELGPGGGVITDAIHNRLPSGGKLVAIEVNRDMVHHLERSRPWLQVIHGDARQLSDLMDEARLPRADAIISALPWTLFSDQQQKRILAEISKRLTPQGIFATVTTLTALPFPAARRFRRHLSETFEQVKISRPVWRNIPPALLYTCRHPITRR